jgi:uncharacterized membrane protein
MLVAKPCNPASKNGQMLTWERGLDPSRCFTRFSTRQKASEKLPLPFSIRYYLLRKQKRSGRLGKRKHRGKTVLFFLHEQRFAMLQRVRALRGLGRKWVNRKRYNILSLDFVTKFVQKITAYSSLYCLTFILVKTLSGLQALLI